MEKNKILLVGLGQCGCNLVDEMISKNKRYAGIFINSSIGDLSNIKNSNDNNTFIFNGTDGAGRNRKLAQNFIQDDIMRLSSFLVKFSQFKVMTLFSSLDGGTGSGSLPFIIKTIKGKLFKGAIVNVVGVLPRIDEDNLKLNNTLDCLAELETLLPMINSIKFIDNNSRESYAEINSEALEDFDLSYSIIGKHLDGNIDLQDSYNVNTCQGYNFTLRLPDRCVSLDEALQVAKDKSVYALPDSFDCIYAGINVKEGIYDFNKLKGKLTTKITAYTTYNKDKFNVIVLGGCSMPNEAIELIKLEVQKREDQQKNFNGFSTNLGFGLKSRKTATTSVKNDKGTTIIADEDISDDMFDADFFRI